MNLTPHFTLSEMLASQAATRLKIAEQFSPDENVIANLKALCTNILEPLRDDIGFSLHISSGYRCPRLNKAIGGSKTSQHMVGEAADIQCHGTTNEQLFDRIQKLKLPFDQLIWEYGTKKEPAWVHVSYSSRNRRQVLFIGVKK